MQKVKKMTLGRAIFLLRRAQGLTHKQVAERARLSISYISLLENNKKQPMVDSYSKLSYALRVPGDLLDMFFDRKDGLHGKIKPHRRIVVTRLIKLLYNYEKVEKAIREALD